MTEVEVVEGEHSTALVLPGSGCSLTSRTRTEIAVAIRDVQKFKAQVAEADRRLREALAERASVLGTKTLYVDGVGKFELKGGQEVHYDAHAIEEGLRELGCPEEVIREVVVETITYKVDGRRAKSAAAANPEYEQCDRSSQNRDRTASDG